LIQDGVVAVQSVIAFPDMPVNYLNSLAASPKTGNVFKALCF